MVGPSSPRLEFACTAPRSLRGRKTLIQRAQRYACPIAVAITTQPHTHACLPHPQSARDPFRSRSHGPIPFMTTITDYQNRHHPSHITRVITRHTHIPYNHSHTHTHSLTKVVLGGGRGHTGSPTQRRLVAVGRGKHRGWRRKRSGESKGTCGRRRGGRGRRIGVRTSGALAVHIHIQVQGKHHSSARGQHVQTASLTRRSSTNERYRGCT